MSKYFKQQTVGELRIEAAKALHSSRQPDRTNVDRARDKKVAEAYKGLADNKAYLSSAESDNAGTASNGPR